jgi:hypothetical protein
MRPSQSIFATAPVADFLISRRPRYTEIPPFFERLFDMTSLDVFFPIWITLAPVSVFCQALAKAIP